MATSKSKTAGKDLYALAQLACVVAGLRVPCGVLVKGPAEIVGTRPGELDPHPDAVAAARERGVPVVVVGEG